MIALGNGATLGFLGGGQLARMSAVAARQLGLGVAILDPDPNCSAAPVADRVVVGHFDDPAATRELASGCIAVTWDTEKVTPEAAFAAQQVAPVFPAPAVLEIVGDRIAQKRWLQANRCPLPDWRPASSAAEMLAAQKALGKCRAKSARGGYDGRGQARLDGKIDADAVFAQLGPSSVEEELDLASELSVLVARNAGGEVRTFPVARNWHTNAILERTLLPSDLGPALDEEALAIGRHIARSLNLVGLLTVELFFDRRGRLLVNEIAARTHNTFHGTIEGCATSQFEQLVRAVCGLPLGSTELRVPTVLLNLLGDLFEAGAQPPFDELLAIPGLSLHLYGKKPSRGRKVGHVVATGRTSAEALLAADRASELLFAGKKAREGQGRAASEQSA